MKYIRAIITLEFPKEELTENELGDLQAQIEELKLEITENCPEGVVGTLAVDEIERC